MYSRRANALAFLAAFLMYCVAANIIVRLADIAPHPIGGLLWLLAFPLCLIAGAIVALKVRDRVR